MSNEFQGYQNGLLHIEITDTEIAALLQFNRDFLAWSTGFDWQDEAISAFLLRCRSKFPDDGAVPEIVVGLRYRRKGDSGEDRIFEVIRITDNYVFVRRRGDGHGFKEGYICPVQRRDIEHGFLIGRNVVDKD